MAKFNIEVELDWVDEEAGYTIDEEIKEQVVRGVKDALLRKATDEEFKRIVWDAIKNNKVKHHRGRKNEDENH